MINANNITKDDPSAVECRKKPVTVHAIEMKEDFFVDTLEGSMRARKGDYLMIGVEGEKYPVKKEIFEKTYHILKQRGANDND